MPGPYDKVDPNMMAGAGGSMMGKGPQGAFAAPEQQVPPGNPIADYYQKRADDLGTDAATGVAGAGVLGGLSLAEILEGNPLAVLGLLGSGGMVGGSAAVNAVGDMRQGTADMWRNRFGNDGVDPTYRRR